MMQEDFMTFYKIRKKNSRLLISWNATIRNKYLFRYESDISRIKIKSLTFTWNFLLKSCVWHKIEVFHTVVDNSSHNSRWQFIVEI